MPGPEFKKVAGNLNIVLSKDQLNEIIHQALGPKGEKIGQVMMVSDACCVDVSVGSSVAGPISSVASSVSHQDRPAEELMHKLDPRAGIKTKVQVPGNIRIK